MSDWYYATADGQRLGPLPAAELHALTARGAIGPQTLVWRDGQASWRPLQEFAVELGLSALPPPLPPTTAPAARAPGLSGCAIAALVGVAGVFLLGVVAILAAIALPAYNDYTLRAQAAGAIAQAQAQQTRVTEFLDAQGRCPTDDDEGFAETDAPALSAVVFGEFEGSDLCGLEATIAAPGKAALDGRKIWLEYHPDRPGWECSSEVDDKHLPVFCRG